MLANNKMQQTSHGQNGGSLLILVFDGRNGGLRQRRLKNGDADGRLRAP
jgi:hypothetical protein